jgi:hypothetical protein
MKVEAGAATTVGAQAASDASGRVLDHVSPAGLHILGMIMDAAGAAGEIIRVQLYRGQDGA